MAVTAKLYGLHTKQLYNKEHNWLGDTYKVMLTTSVYTPDQDLHDYQNDITNEVVGTNYTAGGVALTGKTIVYTDATNTLTLDANDAQWASSSITARTAVIYNDSPGLSSAKGLVCYQQSDADVISSGGNFDLIFNAAGIVNIVVA